MEVPFGTYIGEVAEGPPPVGSIVPLSAILAV